MMSLSEEWAALSRAMYGEEFIEELAGLLKENKVKTILECGCGDGYILQGLAKRGFSGMGVDANPEMIALALENNQHQNISYRKMNWLDIRNLEERFDAVICRGNSLAFVVSWGREHINSKKTKIKIYESVSLFFQRLKQEGLLYIDTCSQEELDKNGGNIKIKTPNIQLKGRIEYDWQRMERRVFGNGKVFGEDFSGGSTSYLLTPNEIKSIVNSFNPSRIWSPKLKNEKNYEVLCARK